MDRIPLGVKTVALSNKSNYPIITVLIYPAGEMLCHGTDFREVSYTFFPGWKLTGFS